MRKLLLISAALGALSLAGGANATQYLLTQNMCSTTCIVGANDGTIDVTNISGGIHVAISLADNIFFNQAGQGHDALGMILTGNPTVSFQNFFDTNLGGVTASADSAFAKDLNTHPSTFDPAPFSENGTGATYNGMKYGFDFVGSPANNGSLVPTAGLKKLTFDILGTGVTTSTVGHDAGAPPLYFTVDVARYSPTTASVVATGVVGATLTTGVPEPASWALMILGFGGVGAVLRGRRQVQAATA